MSDWDTKVELAASEVGLTQAETVKLLEVSVAGPVVAAYPVVPVSLRILPRLVSVAQE